MDYKRLTIFFLKYNNFPFKIFLNSFRIGTGSRDDNLKKTIREGFPGPGNYSLKGDSSLPSFKFGSEKRGAIAKNDTPGPGQYRIPCTIADVAAYSKSGNGFSPYYKFV